MQSGQIGVMAVAAVLAWVVGAAPGATRTYSVSPLDPPPGYSEFYPSGINASGQVVGTAVDAMTGLSMAVIWRDGAAQTVGTLGGAESHAMALNDGGTVVGDAATDGPEGEAHAFAWYAEGMRDLGRPGYESAAAAINSAGLIVGYERDGLGNAHAMLWDREVGHRLDRFERGFSDAVAVNQRGQAVITYYGSGPGGSPETLVADNGPLTFIGAFQASGINAAGQIVGYHATPLPDVQGLLWDGISLLDLGDSQAPLLPLAINDTGQVVGSTLTAGGEEHAAMWQDGSLQDLNSALPADTGWVLTAATALNNAGQVVGYGVLDGQERAFILTPVR